MGWQTLSKINQFISNEAFLFFIFQMCFKRMVLGCSFFYPDWRTMVVVSLFTVLAARLIYSHHFLLSSRDLFLILLHLSIYIYIFDITSSLSIYIYFWYYFSFIYIYTYIYIWYYFSYIYIYLILRQGLYIIIYTFSA